MKSLLKILTSFISFQCYVTATIPPREDPDYNGAPFVNTEDFDNYIVDNVTLSVRGKKPWFFLFCAQACDDNRDVVNEFNKYFDGE